jgi:hypothetical protein
MPLVPALLVLVPLVPIPLVLVLLLPTPLVLVPVPFAIWVLWALLFQPDVTPRLPSVAPPA